jgi:hypothetical protein
MSAGVIRSSVPSSSALRSITLRRAPAWSGRTPELERGQFAADDARHALRVGQDVEQVGNLRHHLLVLADDLVLLQAGQALQAHLQDFLRLVVAQAVQAIGLQAVAAPAGPSGR